MNLRKFSSQTYYQSLKQTTSDDIEKPQQCQIEPEQFNQEQEQATEATPRKGSLSPSLHLERMKNLLTEKPTTPQPKKSNKQHTPLSATSQFLKKFKQKYTTSQFQLQNTIKTEESPIKRTHYNQQSHKEQEDTVQRLINWDKKKKQKQETNIKLKLFKETEEITGKPSLNADSIKMVEQGLAKYKNQFEQLILQQDRNIQAQFKDYIPLQKWNKFKYNKKLIIEREQNELIQDDTSNSKETQTIQSYLQEFHEDNNIKQAINNSEINRKNQIAVNYYIPIQERAKYDMRLKELKLREHQLKLEAQELSRSVTKSQHQPQFKQFLIDQESYQKKKNEHIEIMQREKIDKITKEKLNCSFQPYIDPTSRLIASKQGKFETRMEVFQENKRKKIDSQMELTSPSFQPKISTKSRQIAYNFYSSCQSYGETDLNELKQFDSQR